jgi:subtilisin family serine protease
VRNAQARLVDDLVAVEQEVQVDRPWAVPLAAPDASKLLLDHQQALQEWAWSELRRQPDGRVEETRLVDDADGIGLADRGHSLDLQLGIAGEKRKRVADRRVALAEIRTDADVGSGHAVAMLSWLSGFGATLIAGLVAALVWSGSAAPATLTSTERQELLAHPHALVLTRDARAAAELRRAGGVRIARSLPVWRVRSRSALRVAGLADVVEPDRFIPVATHFSSGDPLVPSQWWITPIGAGTVEPPGPGKPVTVVDTGIDLSHPEFAGRPSTIALNEQSIVGQSEDHGTAVASTIAAPPNAQGIVGVYPQAALQIWDASPTGPGISVSGVVAGIDTALRRGTGVINLSLGSPFRDPLLEAIVTVAFGTGSLVVAASGNDRSHGSPLEYPGSFPHVLTVGAIDQSGRAAYFSSGSPYVDLAAPGQAIPVAVPPSTYSSYSGTSFATPLTAGAAAWVWTARPTLEITQLFDLMRSTTQDIETPGFDPYTGFGRLDIPRALTAAPLPADPNEPNDDVDHIKPKRLFRQGDPPLNSPRRLRATLRARLDFGEDQRDVYRVWVAGRRVTAITISPRADVDVALWGPRTATVFEGGGPRRRDLKALSEKPGTRRETVRVRNTARRGAYYYVEAYLGAAAPVRRVGAVSYKLTVSNAKI